MLRAQHSSQGDKIADLFAKHFDSPPNTTGLDHAEAKRSSNMQSDSDHESDAGSDAKSSVSSNASKKRKRGHASDSDEASRASNSASSRDPTSSPGKRHESNSPSPKENISYPTLPSLKTLSSQEQTASTSPFVTQVASLYLPLPPISQQQPLQGLCAAHLSPLLLTYYAPLHGVVLAYHSPYLSNEPPAVTTLSTTNDREEDKANEPVYAKAIDEYAASYTWLTATFVLLRADSNGRTEMEGYITLQSESQIGLLCYNQFNATISRLNLPSEWKWSLGNKAQRGEGSSDENGEQTHESEGSFVDGEGKRVEGLLRFRVIDMDCTTGGAAAKGEGLVSIEGSLHPPGSGVRRGIDDVVMQETPRVPLQERTNMTAAVPAAARPGVDALAAAEKLARKGSNKGKTKKNWIVNGGADDV